MRKIYLLFGFALTFGLGYSQTNLTLGAPLNNGSTTQLRAPNGTSTHTTLRGHLIVSAAEMAGIPSGTVINGLGFLYSAGADIPAGGTIQFYLENTTDATNLKSTTWATAISTMTNVYNGTYSIPVVAGSTNVSLTSSFTYTGGGVYVAYDYLGTTFSTLPATYLCNTAIGGGVKVDATATTTPPATLTGSSGFRPEIEFSFPNPYSNNLAIEGLFAGKGNDNILLGATQNVETVVRNISNATLTNIPVSINIAGANPYTATQTIVSIAPGAASTINFAGIPKTNIGVQTVVVSIPPDQQTSNDLFSLTQNIHCDKVGYAYGDSITGGLGYNTGSGILANLLVLPSGAPLFVKKVIPTIDDATANIGNSIKGVLLNAAGVIVDSTAIHTITAAELGNPVVLTFLNGSVNHAGDSVYYGFRQYANATAGYFPMAMQELTGTIVPVDLFCGFGSNGGSYANYTQFGASVMDAVITSKSGNSILSTNSFNGSICSGTILNLTSATGFSNYNFVVDATPVQNGTNNSYSYTPTATTTASVIVNTGNCSFGDTVTIAQMLSISSFISTSICSGEIFDFNGTLLSNAGTFIDTIPSSAGCDSIITLTLAVHTPNSSFISETVCDTVYQFGNQIISTSGTYWDTLINMNGCDSIVTLNLTLKQPSSSTSSLSLCDTAYLFGGVNRMFSGTYYDTLVNAIGCDSIVTLHLTLNQPVWVEVLQNAGILIANPIPNSVDLQWIECPSYTAINGANSINYSPLATGNYAVIATGTGGCVDTSDCYLFDQTSLEENAVSTGISIYPNPSSNKFHIDMNNVEAKRYSVFDSKGKLVCQERLVGNKKSFDLNLAKYESGMYLITIDTENQVIRKSIVKE